MIVSPSVAPFIMSRSASMSVTGGTVEDIRIGGATWRTHIFTSSGTLNVQSLGPNAGLVEVFLVGGGGGGGAGFASCTSVPLCCYDGRGGGGGGGGVITPRTERLEVQSYSIVVGNGGAGDTDTSTTFGNIGSPGGASSAFGLTALGGGPGASRQNAPPDGASGGGNGQMLSFGCAPYHGMPGNGTSEQGQNALRAATQNSAQGGAIAGGGAGFSSANQDAIGGEGYVLDWLGEPIVFGSGGGGGANSAQNPGGTNAGTGGKLNGCGVSGNDPTPGVPNRGGGGGGGAGVSANCGSGLTAFRQNGAAGGSGIVIVRYKL